MQREGPLPFLWDWLVCVGQLHPKSPLVGFGFMLLGKYLCMQDSINQECELTDGWAFPSVLLHCFLKLCLWEIRASRGGGVLV